MRPSWPAHDKITALEKSPKPSYREKEKVTQGNSPSQARTPVRAEAGKVKTKPKASGEGRHANKGETLTRKRGKKNEEIFSLGVPPLF